MHDCSPIINITRGHLQRPFLSRQYLFSRAEFIASHPENGECRRDQAFLWRPRMSLDLCVARRNKMALCQIISTRYDFTQGRFIGRLDKYYLLSRVKFIAWYLRNPKMENGEIKHFLWRPRLSSDSCTPTIKSLCQIWLGGKSDKYNYL